MRLNNLMKLALGFLLSPAHASTRAHEHTHTMSVTESTWHAKTHTLPHMPDFVSE